MVQEEPIEEDRDQDPYGGLTDMQLNLILEKQ